MDNCGGGQRLPPDGDEFPASYQEFNTVEQYQCITTTRNTTMTTNGTLESQAFVTNESFKMVPGEGSSNGMTTAERTVIASKSVLLPDNRVIVQTVVDDVKETNLLPGTAPIKCYPACEESPKGPVFANTFSKSNATVVSEKKIEISGYPQILDSDGQKDLETSSPPPLPLTNPPKNDLVVSLNRTVPADSQRKFSLNSELRRQDDKSEKSVRDKIAMFSSQSSLEAPLFPSVITVSVATTTGRRLSKYKSSEDVFAEEKSPKEKISSFGKRTQSSFDLTDSAKYCPRPSLPANSPPSSTTLDVRNSPKSVTVPSCQNSFDSKSNSPSMKPLVSSTTSFYPTIKSFQSPISSPIAKPANAPSLTRATSFSGASNNYSHERPQSSSEILANNQVARTNSLASTFRRPSEEMRRTSLNQLIEQRRKSMSKLRGLVIPERDAVPVEQPIVDLPEIKSRDSILLQQIPKSNIYDKWGSQSSLASNASTASVPLKATTSFKMPAPQIHSKYSPAFKRKSLSVCGSTPSSSALKPSQADPPKSLESICSPTRSDYSFEFVSSSGSPETPRSKPRTLPKKSRADYDDSDNDSAVSSSQSSISRGFSPPMSPVPSERSTVSSERSYVPSDTNYSRQLIMESSMRNFGNDRQPFTAKSNNFSERNYVDRSSSNGSSPDARSPQPGDPNPRNSQIPQRQSLKRSNSTDTNCSTSSTLTSGSQASTESISRRVLKPQSVEAINRKNILASARCRSGRDLNGSPLIQRKFSDEEDVQEKSGSYRATNGTSKSLPSKPDIKIAYIEVTDTFVGDDDEDDVDNELNEKKFDDPKKPVKRTTIPQPTSGLQKSEIVLETSNDLKMWVRSEAMALMNQEKSNGEKPSSSVILEKTKPNHPGIIEANPSQEVGKAKPRKDEEDQSDLLSVLQTRSRTRSAIHVEDAPFGGSKSQMSLEDLLGGKAETKKIRPQGPNAEKNGRVPANETRRKAPGDSPMETKGFASKIPTLGRVKSETQEEYEVLEKSSKPMSKIPTASKSLGRRSVSVNDMKKALERNESVPGVHNNHATAPVGTHNRFLSLDSSVEEPISPVGTDERYCREQFGSISSLASSTSLISQHELAQLVEEASLEEARGAHEVIVVLLHKENPAGSVGITLAGGVDCEVKEITVHRVLTHSIADKDGRVQRGDRILSINGRSTRGLTHRESLAVLKQPRSEVVLVVSRSRLEDAGCKLRSRTESVETIVEGFETNSGLEDTAWGPPSTVAIYKDGAGLGFSLEGGRDSPLGDRPLVIKKIFTGGAAEKTGALRAGDQLLEVNGNDVTRMSRIEAWSLMKKLHDGEVNLLVRHPATKSS